MTWAKLSDTFNDDPALLRLSRGRRLLYVELTVWSCKQETDGHVPAYVVARVTDEPDPADAVADLAAAGLLEAGDDDGWLLTRFADEQRSANELAAARVNARERQERRRRHLSGDHSQCLAAYCTSTSRRDNRSDVARESRDPVLPVLSCPDPPVPSSSEGTGEVRQDGQPVRLADARRPAAVPPASPQWEGATADDVDEDDEDDGPLVVIRPGDWGDE